MDNSTALTRDGRREKNAWSGPGPERLHTSSILCLTDTEIYLGYTPRISTLPRTEPTPYLGCPWPRTVPPLGVETVDHLLIQKNTCRISPRSRTGLNPQPKVVSLPPPCCRRRTHLPSATARHERWLLNLTQLRRKRQETSCPCHL